jgi:hypothetical protein
VDRHQQLERNAWAWPQIAQLFTASLHVAELVNQKPQVEMGTKPSQSVVCIGIGELSWAWVYLLN